VQEDVPVTAGRWPALLASLAAGLGLCAAALAQEGQRGVKVVPDEDLVEQLAPGKSMDTTIVLPPAPDPAGDRSLATLPRIALRQVVIEDVSVLSPDEVAATVASYEGREVASEELEELRRRLSLLYFEKGHVNSGVELPDQEVVDGVIRFREVRGTLTEVRLSGNRHLNDRYVLGRVDQRSSQPLEINALQASLRLLEQEPLIGRIDAQLVPGTHPGDGVLRLELTENRPWQLVFGADNHRSPAVGGEQATLLFRHLSLSGRGDTLTLYGSYADGYGDAYGSYAVPLNVHGTTFALYGSKSDSDIVEEPFDEIDIESRTHTYGFSLTHPFHRSLTGMFSAFVGLEFRHNENTLLGSPFSFTYGERDGETDVSVVYGGVELAKRAGRSVNAVRLGVRQGLHKWGATENGSDTGAPANGPDGKFTSLLLQAQHVRSLEWRDSTLVARATLQRALDPLLSIEKLPVGGASTVRGYRENLLVRDNGVIASLEWRVPLYATEAPTGRFDPRRLKLAVFADYGRSWDTSWKDPLDPGFELASRKAADISSAGLGLLWDPAPGVHAEIYWGHAFEDQDTGGGDLQDDGIHLRFSWNPWN
jgi:hemolysin activation/secretion protein